VSQRLRLPYQQDMRRRACLLAPRPPWHSAPPPARAAGRAPWPQRPVRPQPKEWTMPAAAAGGEAGSALGKAFLSGLVPHQEAALDIAKVELAKGQNPKVMAWLPPSSLPAEGGRRHDGIASAGCGSRPRRPTGRHGGAHGHPAVQGQEHDGSRPSAGRATSTTRSCPRMMIPHHASAIVMAD